jgi:L-ascorbate metabolism protein UlaG (beta-lactamase superfamily)
MSFTIKWLGHASFQINIEGKVIYTDPYSGKYSEKANLILLTHSHGDHCSVAKIKSIRDADTTVFAPEDCVKKIKGTVRTLKAGGEATVGNVKIKAVEAYNVKRFKSPGNPFHPRGFGVGYLITALGKTVYHAGDTDLIPEMKQLGHVDVALLPSGDTYTMDNAEAAEAAFAINPVVVVPMHRWDTKPDEFKKKVEASSSIKVVSLAKGEEYQVV